VIADSSTRAATESLVLEPQLADVRPDRFIRRGWLVRRTLLAADVVGLTAAFLLAEVVFSRNDIGRIGFYEELVLFVPALPVWVVVAKLYRLYEHDEERPDHSTVDDLVGLFNLVTAGTWLVLAFCWATGLAGPNFRKIAIFWIAAVVFVAVARAVARFVCRRSTTYTQNTIIVGGGPVGQLVARKLLSHPEYRLDLVGFVDSGPPDVGRVLSGVPTLGPAEQLPLLIEDLCVERVIIAFSTDPYEKSLELVRVLKDYDVQVDIVPRLFEIVGIRAGITSLEGLPLISLPPLKLSRSSLLLKRVFDAVVASVGLVLLSPLMLLLALLVKLDSPGPAFFSQERMGAGGNVFRIHKFRSMVVGAEEQKPGLAARNRYADLGDDRLFKVADDPRMTRFGGFLRRWSLDELPQLLNVLRGEMSMVGPRPLVLEEDEHVHEWGRSRLKIKPGITGPWQVVGRAEMPFDEMINLDYHYVTGWSLFHDVSLMLRTVRAVVRPRSAY
jgi:exopolysaccharide biosynthesis polyprenyl glycosylphosphotransferase